MWLVALALHVYTYINKYIYIGGAIIARLVGVKLGLRFYGTYMGSL